MESLAYIGIILTCFVALLLIASLFTFVVGLIMITMRLVGGTKGKRRIGCIPVGLVIVGGFISAMIVASIWLSIQIPLAQSERSEGATCQDLFIGRRYKLQIVQYHDGTTYTSLEKFDGSQVFIHGITRAAIEGDILVGLVGPQDSPTYWFWVDLEKGGSIHSFDDQTEFLADLQRLGVMKQPALMPVSALCASHDCRPCPK